MQWRPLTPFVNRLPLSPPPLAALAPSHARCFAIVPINLKSRARSLILRTPLLLCDLTRLQQVIVNFTTTQHNAQYPKWAFDTPATVVDMLEDMKVYFYFIFYCFDFDFNFCN